MFANSFDSLVGVFAAFVVVPLTLIGLAVAAWSKRVARKTNSKRSLRSLYWIVVLKMIWRVAVIAVVALLTIVFYDTTNYISDQRTAEKVVIFIPLLLLVCTIVVLVSSWKAVKMRFATPPPLPKS